MKNRQRRTVLDYAVAQVGLRRGTRVGLFIAQWLIAQKALGYEPTVDQAADWWRENRATWFRRQAEFREAFPDQDNPSAICRHLIEQHSDQRATRAEIGSVLGWLGSIEYGLTV